MAITLTASNPKGAGFIANGNSDDFSGTEEIVAAVSGKKIMLLQVTISSNAAITISIGAGETGGALTTLIVGPIYMAANSNMNIDFAESVALATATALCVDASGAGAATVICRGTIE